MAERYDVAAWRHLETGTLLKTESRLDDAGYHFGVSGENAIKFALRSTQMDAHWSGTGGVTLGVSRRPRQPMSSHVPSLVTLVDAAKAEIRAFAAGRYAPALIDLVDHTLFPVRFRDWSIDIRYADDRCTPVLEADCSQWQIDAEEILLAVMV